MGKARTRLLIMRLVEKLPACRECGSPATYVAGDERMQLHDDYLCDQHYTRWQDPMYLEVGYAMELRALCREVEKWT
jgi:hypothetical protein